MDLSVKWSQGGMSLDPTIICPCSGRPHDRYNMSLQSFVVEGVLDAKLPIGSPMLLDGRGQQPNQPGQVSKLANC